MSPSERAMKNFVRHLYGHSIFGNILKNMVISEYDKIASRYLIQKVSLRDILRFRKGLIDYVNFNAKSKL